MPLLYPEDARARYGHTLLWAYDARGRMIPHVCACDPLTGEVIDILPLEHWISPLLIATERFMETIGVALSRRGVALPRVKIARRHWFAPAPLRITAVPPKEWTRSSVTPSPSASSSPPVPSPTGQ